MPLSGMILAATTPLPLAAAALALAAVMLALVLRWAAVPGGRSAAAIVAGISIGLLAGPGVLGRGWPSLHQRLFLGGEHESIALAELTQRHRQEVLALTASGVTGSAVAEHRERQAQELAPLIASRDEARRARRATLDLMTQCALALYLALIGPSLVPRGRTGARWRGWNRWFGRSVGAGFLATFLSGIVPGALGAWLMRLSFMESIAFALILGVPGLSAVLPPALFIASAVALFACLSIGVLLGWSIGMTIVATGLCLGLMSALGIENAAFGRMNRRWGGLVAHGVMLPAAAALLAVHVDLNALASASTSRFWWALVIAALWSSDGRWLAWMLSIRTLGRPLLTHPPWRAGADCVNAGVGVAQLGLTIVLSAAGLADGSVIAAGLLGAAIVEVTRGMRVWMAGVMDRG